VVSRRQGRPKKYDWDGLLVPGKTFTFHKGTDYDCTTSAVVAQIRTAASRKGVSARIVVAEDERSLAVKVDRHIREELASAT